MSESKTQLALKLGQESLTAGDLRKVTGLSYRQVNEWDKRGALPHQREKKGGWRRVNVWQAMALKIVAELRDKFAIPLTKQRELLHWLIGNTPQTRDEIWFNSAFFIIRHLGESGLTERGLRQSDAKHLLQRLESLWDERTGGEETLKDLVTFTEIASSTDDIQIRMEIQRLCSALLPLYSALGGMSTGYAMYLVSDLEHHALVDELALVDGTARGLLFDTSLVVRVDLHINSVLEVAGRPTLPVTMRAADVNTDHDYSPNEAEQQILKTLREGDFERLIIEPRNGGYRMVLGREYKGQDLASIETLLEDSDFQTITLVKSDGRIVRIAQEVSFVTESPGDDGTGRVVRSSTKSHKP